MVGINDMWCAIDKNIMLKNFRTILDTFIKDAPWAKIYIESILPAGQAALDKNPKLKNFAIENMNSELKKLAADLNIQYLDIGAEYKNNQGRMGSEYSVDGIHLLKDSYNKWANRVRELIKGY